MLCCVMLCVWWKEVIGDALTAKIGYTVDELLLVVWSYCFLPKFKTIKMNVSDVWRRQNSRVIGQLTIIVELLKVMYENPGLVNCDVVLFTRFALTSSPLLQMPWSRTNTADHQSNRSRCHCCNPARIHGAPKRHPQRWPMSENQITQKKSIRHSEPISLKMLQP